MSIISSLDSRSLLLTHKLLQQHYPSLAIQLAEAAPHQHLLHGQLNPKLNNEPNHQPITDIDIELDIETINRIIDKLIKIGKKWLEESPAVEGIEKEQAIKNNHSRHQILSMLLKEWINVGNQVNRYVTLDTENNTTRLH